MFAFVSCTCLRLIVAFPYLTPIIQHVSRRVKIEAVLTLSSPRNMKKQKLFFWIEGRPFFRHACPFSFPSQIILPRRTPSLPLRCLSFVCMRGLQIESWSAFKPRKTADFASAIGCGIELQVAHRF